MIKRKSKLVVKGFTQQKGIDYHETFSPTLKSDSIRIFTALAIQNNFDIHQIYINATYFNAYLRLKLFRELDIQPAMMEYFSPQRITEECKVVI